MKKSMVIKKILFATIMIGVIFLSSSPAKANVWWAEQLPSQVLKQVWEEFYLAFKEAMVANLKNQANRLISDRVRALLTGQSSSRPLFVTNYEDFIFGSAERVAKAYTRDIFTSVNRTAGAYTKRTMGAVQETVQGELNDGIDKAVSTIDDYVSGGTEKLFDKASGGSESALLATAVNPYNNVYGAYANSRVLVESKAHRVSESSKYEVLSGNGFISKVDPKTNLIDLPGSILKDLVATAESLPMMMIAYAKSIPEVAGNLAARIVSGAIETGIAKVTKPVDDKLADINRNVKGGVKKVQKDIYNGIKFTK